jgi:hypothetical protein
MCGTIIVALFTLTTQTAIFEVPTFRISFGSTHQIYINILN